LKGYSCLIILEFVSLLVAFVVGSVLVPHTNQMLKCLQQDACDILKWVPLKNKRNEYLACADTKIFFLGIVNKFSS